MHKLIFALSTLSAVIILTACQPENSASNLASDTKTAAAEISKVTESKQATQSESERLNLWFEGKYEEKLQMSPLKLTMLGRKDKYDQFNTMSRKERVAELTWQRKSVEEMTAIFDYNKLDMEAQASYDIWTLQYKQAQQRELYYKNVYIFTQMNGKHAFLTQFLINFHNVDDESDMIAYNKRLTGVGVALANLLAQAKENAAYGVRPPKFAYQTVIEESQNIITGAPFDKTNKEAPIWADAQNKVLALVEAKKISPARAEALLAKTKAAMKGLYKQSYESIITWFQADINNTAVMATGVGKQPNGKAYYDMKLKDSTTTELTADEIHAIGLAEVSRLTNEMVAIKERVGFAGSLQSFFKFIKEDEQFYYPDTDEGRLAYISDTEVYLAFIGKKLPDYFGLLPKTDLVVKRVEAFREQPGAAQHYFAGTPDGTRAGVYYAHLSDMRSMPKTEMEAIAYHEGNPGHHMQISIAQELTSVPTFRTQAGFTAYMEGWALYAEFLAKEMGAYQSDYADFGRLITEIWRAVRLVVDTGIHAKGWTEEQAIAYFKEKAPVAPDAIISEVRRYIVWPGQATAYKIGMLEILHLRAFAQEELGEKFDIKAFHDTVLGGGALPLSVLNKRVKAWVNKVNQG